MAIPDNRPRPARPPRACLLGLLALAAASCGVEPRPAATGARNDIAPAEIIVVPAQVTLEAGASAQLSAQVNDGAGQPIGGAPLSFTSSAPSMLRVSERGALVATGPAGEARVDVSSGALTHPVRVVVVPGAASRIEVTAGADQSAMVGETLDGLVTVRVVDAFGNGLPGAPVRFDADEGGTVQPASATTDDRGLSRVAWTLGQAAGRHVLRVSTQPGAVAVEVAATATPGRPQRLVKVGGDESAVAAGAEATLRAQVLDALGNPVPGTPVEWSTAAAGARLAPAAAATDASGLAECVVATAPAVGPLDVTASIATGNGRQAIVFAVLTRAGPPARVVARSAENQSGRAGQPAGARPAVQVTDQHGNPVAGAAVTFSVAAGDGGVEGASQVTGKDGVATVGRWTLGPGDNELRAAVEGVEAAVAFRATAKR